MIVNTGRAASRAFHLNLKRQKNLYVISRYELDKAATQHISHRNTAKLDHLVDIANQFAVHDGTTLGTVLHGTLPRLYRPFGHERNIRFLSEVRDRLKISTIFFPMRPAREVFTSELNRLFALDAGDWRFQQSENGWQSPFALSTVTCDQTAASSCEVKLPVLPNKRLEKLARYQRSYTGQFHALLQLFRAVFDDIQIFRYSDFMTSPETVFAKIARYVDLSFSDTKLMNSKLNSLANRLLIYNPITIEFPGQATKKGWSFGAKPDQTSRVVRYRYELKHAIEHCDDWGIYWPVDLGSQRVFPRIEKDLNGEVALGVNVKDLLQLSDTEREFATSPMFVQRLHAATGPVFEENYQKLQEFYRNEVYTKSMPDDLYDEIYTASDYLEAEKEIANHTISFM